ncbi:mannitol dehydrogenase family protein [Actinobaculum sp. 313]|uniref:mannitol dehydrogenase family protein n=1 Tax=Actinobaculum sp. 313 TaxID=2495645 RepID=UPI000D5287BA|nr:mannitol dehydrogenase family protein [Actinobaculum sp. 313]AWE42422.1 mannitol dehydrogenase family protein [Actinobaculum sp. 313]
MELSIAGLKQGTDYATAGISVPTFDVAQMQASGRETPRWVHLGPGNIFRVFIAKIAHSMIADGKRWPITAVVPRDAAKLDLQLAPHDLMTLGVTLNPDGTRSLDVIAGMGEALAASRIADFERLMEVAVREEVTLVSLTITEKGYAVRDSSGDLAAAARHAITADPHQQQSHAMALLATLLLRRWEAGGPPITLLSCDNFSHNGDKLRDAIFTIIGGWAERGAVSPEFVAWVRDGSRVAFPISVIDKITPLPNQSVADDLAELGFSDMGLVTAGQTPVAGFVNTESAQYLVIEDNFAAQRPPFEEYGVQMVSREVCDAFEHMKVTTCLNPLHTALAVTGCLLRFPTIDAEMRDPLLAELVHRLGWSEGLPVVVDPGIVSPADFLTEVETVRFPNRYLPDDPARIAMDTSQKLPIRFGETIKRYLERGLGLEQLEVIPLVFALWCRYLMGIADDGAPFTPSSDPLLEELQAHVSHIALGDHIDVHEALNPILANAEIFAVDLYETPLAAKVENYFSRLIAGPGAVRAVLAEVLNKESE